MSDNRPPPPSNSLSSPKNLFGLKDKTSLPPLKHKTPPTTPKTPENESRSNSAFYSDHVVSKSGQKLAKVTHDANLTPSLLWKTNSPGNIPKTSVVPVSVTPLLRKAKLASIGATTENTKKSDFGKDSFKPKVQIPFTVPPGNKPRRVQIERDRRTFNIEKPKELMKIFEAECKLR